MTHTHVAGSIHADVGSRAPGWLAVPDDVNALLPSLWSDGVGKDDDGVLDRGRGRRHRARRAGRDPGVRDRRGRPAGPGAGVRRGVRGLARLLRRQVVPLHRGRALGRPRRGSGIDTCTGGELAVAQRAGSTWRQVGLHGNNKSEAELCAGPASRGRADHRRLLRRDRAGWAHLAGELGVRPRVMVRVTTGVEAHTHEYISTAHEDQKFGFSIAGGAAAEALAACHADARLDLVGIHSHIGSQIFDAEGFEVAARRTLRLHADFAAAHGSSCPSWTSAAASASPTPARTRRPRPRDLAAALNRDRRRRVRRARRRGAAAVDRARSRDQRPERLRALHGRDGQAGRASTAARAGCTSPSTAA